MAYYFDHQADIDREISDEIDQLERDQSQTRRSAIYQRLAGPENGLMGVPLYTRAPFP